MYVSRQTCESLTRLSSIKNADWEIKSVGLVSSRLIDGHVRVLADLTQSTA